MIYTLLLFVATFITSGCLTQHPIAQWRRETIQDVEVLLEHKQYARVVTILPSLKVEPRQKERIFRAVRRGMKEEYEVAGKKGQHTRKYVYGKNLLLLHEPVDPPVSEKKLLRNIIFEEDIADRKISVALAQLAHIDLNIFSTKDLLALLTWAKEYHTWDIYQTIIDTLMKRKVKKKQIITSKQAIDFSHLFDGMLTILVDRGTTIDQGVGRRIITGGSGFFIQADGYFLTNYHVIESVTNDNTASHLSVLFSDGKEEKNVHVVSYDPILDIALLKVDKTTNNFFAFAYRPPRVAESVFALGSPGFLKNTLTAGIVSVNNRTFFSQIGGELQFDASVNPGNSGGPLITSAGSVIGINYMKRGEGVGFAIPSHWISLLLPRLFFTKGEITHLWIGVGAHKTDLGLEVRYVAPGTAAAYAGLRVLDTIVALNGYPVQGIQSVHEFLFKLSKDSLFEIQYLRKGVKHTYILSAFSRPESPTIDGLRYTGIENFFPLFFGILLEKRDKGFRVKDIISKEDRFLTNDANFFYTVESPLLQEMEKGDIFRILDWNVNRELQLITIRLKFILSAQKIKKTALYRVYYDSGHYM